MLRNPFVPKFDLKKVMEQAPKESKVKEIAPKAVSSLAIASKSNSGDFPSKLALVGYMFITNPTITADELAAVVEAEYPRAFALQRENGEYEIVSQDEAQEQHKRIMEHYSRNISAYTKRAKPSIYDLLFRVQPNGELLLVGGKPIQQKYQKSHYAQYVGAMLEGKNSSKWKAILKDPKFEVTDEDIYAAMQAYKAYLHSDAGASRRSKQTNALLGLSRKEKPTKLPETTMKKPAAIPPQYQEDDDATDDFPE